MSKNSQNSPILGTARVHPVSEYRRLKEKFSQLLSECGGATQINSSTRVGSSALYQMASTNEIRHFPPIDVIADLERLSGDPTITRVLAELAGYALIPTVPAKVSGSFSVALARLGKEISDVFSDSAKALEDNRLTSKEARKLLKDVDEAQAVIEELRQRLRVVADSERTVFHELMEAA